MHSEDINSIFCVFMIRSWNHEKSKVSEASMIMSMYIILAFEIEFIAFKKK